jgi:uncharacterized membrane protein YbhN (UPF0104 family)
MKTVKRYLSSGEADFAKSLLDSAGIDAFVAQESTGYLLANGGIRVQVPDPDIDRATRILEHKEAGFDPLPDDFIPPEESPSAPPVRRRKSSPFFAFLIGGLLALAVLGLDAITTAALGGAVQVNVGALLLLFLIGGAAGIIIHGISSR